MIICKNHFRKFTKTIQMNASGYKVNQVPKVKILGHIIQTNLHNDKQINKTIGNINNHLYNIKKLGTQTMIKSPSILVKAVLLVFICFPSLSLNKAFYGTLHFKITITN